MFCWWALAMTRIRHCIWQMPVRSTPASTTVWNTVRLWKTVDAYGRNTARSLSMARDFDEIGAAFGANARFVRRLLGNGIIRFMRQRELVDFAVGWIERHRGRLE